MPPKRAMNYEKVKTDDFISGVIEDVQYDPAHKFTFKGTESVAHGVRLKFKLDGYQYSHFSRWMKFNYGEKSNLYQKYLLPLVENAKSDMEFDLDQLKGIPVKTLWNEKNDFQGVETIRPIGKKVTALNVYAPKSDLAEVVEEDEVPF